MHRLYESTFTSKTGEIIPCFSANRPMHSKYSPIKEAEALTGQSSPSDYYIILGLGGGFVPEILLNQSQNSFLLIVENSKEDIDFLKENIPQVLSFFSNKRICICTIEDAIDNLKKTFLPVLYNNLSLIEIRSWVNENKESVSALKQQFHQTINTLIADYSVQAHFGKIWQSNIMKNLKHASQEIALNFDTSKTALITAAGPTLDTKIPQIIANREKYYIIATDTTFSVLKKLNIKTDAVCSLDGQFISLEHFTDSKDFSPLYVFDLQANHNIVKKLDKENAKIFFTRSNHPLIKYALQNQKDFTYLESGSGTVTIQAIDFALKAGFKNIEVIGADFSYPYNKCYAKGTYLDSIYNRSSLKIKNSQTEFCKLMYRTELFYKNKVPTTKVLQSYKNSLIDWLNCKNLSFYEKNNTWYIKNNLSEKLICPSFDFNKFILNLKNDTEKFLSEINTDSFKQSNLTIALFPFIAYLKNNSSNKNISFEELVKLALQNIVRYT